jgi:hypothetical protein
LIENEISAVDRGIVHDILKLSAMIKINEATCLITESLVDLVKEELPTSQIYIGSGYFEGPGLEVGAIEEKLNAALLSSDWTYEKLIRRTRASCFSPRRTHMPDRDEMTTEVIAEHFQVTFPKHC